MNALCDELRERLLAARAGGGPDAIAKHRTRGKLTARERIDTLIDPGSDFLEFSALAALRHVRQRLAERRHGHRHRVRRRPALRHRRQRRDRQRRHVLSDDREEASARARDRRAESSAVHLSGRLGRRVLAAASRSLSRPRSFRAHLLQSSAHVGQAHPADRRGDGLVHRRRRVRAGDERRDGDRARDRHDLSSAARRWSKRRPAKR